MSSVWNHQSPPVHDLVVRITCAALVLAVLPTARARARSRDGDVLGGFTECHQIMAAWDDGLAGEYGSRYESGGEYESGSPVVGPVSYDAAPAGGAVEASLRGAREADPLDARVQELEGQVKTLSDAAAKAKQSESEKPTGKITLEVQPDVYFFGQDADNRAAVGDIQDGSAFRRARVGWTGQYSITEYRIEFDMAQTGRPTFLDVWGAVNEVPVFRQVKVGHYFEPFSLERLTSNRVNSFLERSLIDQAFVPARNLGVGFGTYTDDRQWTWSAGVFRTNSDNFGDDTGDNGERSCTTRGTWMPYYDEPSGGRYYCHLGGGYSVRDTDNDVAQFRSQPEARIGAVLLNNVPFFVDTGPIAARMYQLYGAEAALVWGSFSMQSEYIYTPVDRIGGADPQFQAVYLQATYFLTGEHRPWRREQATFDRIHPFEEFFLVRTSRGVCAGSGAWEVAARVSHLDLNDAGIQGGRLTDFTAGLNWYLTPYLRTQFNYVRALLDDPTTGNSAADIYGMRFQYDF